MALSSSIYLFIIKPLSVTISILQLCAKSTCTFRLSTMFEESNEGNEEQWGIPLKPWLRFRKFSCVCAWRLFWEGDLPLCCIRVTVLHLWEITQSEAGALVISTSRTSNHKARHTIWGWSAHTCLAPSFPLGKWQEQIATCLFACRRDPPENI